MGEATPSLTFQRAPAENRITVVMPCYNSAAHLREAISSVLRQTYADVELVVVDDGSTDASPEILGEFEGRIVVHRQANRGPGPARNRGIELGSGELFAFLDADDYWDDHCLETLHSALTDGNKVLAYCGWQNVGAGPGRDRPFVPPDYEQDDKAEQFLRRAAPWPIHAALLRRSALEEAGGFDEQWPTCMDYDLWLRMAISRPIVLVPQVLAYYRHHDSSQITATQWRQARNVWLVKRNFVRRFPDLVAHISRSRVRELVDGGLLERGIDRFWKRDLVSAHKIFRLSLRHGYWTRNALPYMLAALLPESLFLRLVQGRDAEAA